jgi:hypothetical protein
VVVQRRVGVARGGKGTKVGGLVSDELAEEVTYKDEPRCGHKHAFSQIRGRLKLRTVNCGALYRVSMSHGRSRESPLFDVYGLAAWSHGTGPCGAARSEGGCGRHLRLTLEARLTLGEKNVARRRPGLHKGR